MSLRDALKQAKQSTGAFTGETFSVVQSILPRLENVSDVLPLKKDDLVRSSGIGRICPREEVLCSLHGINREFKVSAKTQMMFSMGHAIHDILRVPIYDMLLGIWVCLNCGTEFGADANPIKKPDACRCGSSSFKYKEIYLKDDVIGIEGHPDGILDVDGDRRLLEIKSTNTSMFTELGFKGPSESYIMQVNCYMFLLKINVCYFVYVNRDTGEMKEFVVRIDENYVTKAKEMVDAIRVGIRTGELPKRTVCSSKMVARAKYCKAAKYCFIED